MAATSPLTGVQGNAVCTTNFATFVVNVYEWTARFESDFFPTEVFGGTEKGHTNYRGMYTVTGTIRGVMAGVQLPMAEFDPGDAPTALTLTERTGKTFSGNAHLHNIQITVNRRTGLNEYTADFTSDGDWTTA